MNNYEVLKRMSLEDLASVLDQISRNAKYPCECLFKFPNELDWIEYLKSNDMYLPFTKNRVVEEEKTYE